MTADPARNTSAIDKETGSSGGDSFYEHASSPPQREIEIVGRTSATTYRVPMDPENYAGDGTSSFRRCVLLIRNTRGLIADRPHTSWIR